MRLDAVRRFGAPSQAAADSDWKCHGTAVPRCATIFWDQTNDTFSAQAKITDVAGGGYVTLRTKADADGWHDVEDSAATSTVDPCNYPKQSTVVVATFAWRGATTGQETWRPNNAWGMLCD